MSPRRRLRRLEDGTVVRSGSLVLEWQRKAVGKITRATGLPDTPQGAKRHARIVAAADKLYERGRLDILLAVKLGQVHPMKLLMADRLDRLDRLPTPEYLLPVAESMQGWINGTRNDDTAKGRRVVMRRLLADDPDLTVGELPGRLKALREAMADTAAGWNRMQQQTLAFLRDTFADPRHPLYEAVSALKSLEVVAKYRRVHLTPAEFHAVLPKLGPAREAFWLLALTGMNPKEAWVQGFDVTPPAVLIHGRKAKTRERVVPWLAPIATPTVSRDVLTWWLNKAGLYPYAARHSYSRWLEDAGIPAWRVVAYMGHRPRTMTETYQRGKMDGYLVGDARLLRDHLGLPQPATTLAVSA